MDGKRHAEIRAREARRGTSEKDVTLLLEILRRQSTPRANLADLTKQALGRGDVNVVCGKKKRYSNEALALSVARRREAAGAAPLRAYPCPYCAAFHLTHHPVDTSRK